MIRRGNGLQRPAATATFAGDFEQALCAEVAIHLLENHLAAGDRALTRGVAYIGHRLGCDAVMLCNDAAPDSRRISTWIHDEHDGGCNLSSSELHQLMDAFQRDLRVDDGPAVTIYRGYSVALMRSPATDDGAPRGVLIAVRNIASAWAERDIERLRLATNFMHTCVIATDQRRIRGNSLLGAQLVGHCVSELAGASDETVQRTLENIVSELGQFYGVDRVGVWDVADGGEGIVATARWQADPSRDYAMARVTANAKFVHRLMESQEPRFLQSRVMLGRDLTLEDHFRPTALEVPLVSAGIVSGSLALASNRFRPWTANEVADVTVIARAIANVRYLATTERRFRTMFEQAPDGITLRDRDGVLLDCNQAYVEFLGHQTREALIGTNATNVVADTSADAQNWLESAVGPPEKRRAAPPLELEYRRQDGQSVFARAQRTELPQLEGEKAVYLTHLQDVTQERRDQEALVQAATSDELTGLHNRRTIATRLEALRSTGTTAVVVLADLDRFKMVNDSLGSDVGDRVLVTIADRLRTTIRPGDLLARLGGDEYAVLMAPGAGQFEGAALATRILQEASKPIEIDGSPIFTDASVGIALSTLEDATAIDVLRHADAAMYQAKDAGRGRYEIYDADMRDARILRLNLENDLRKAIPNDELVVHYQPEIDLETGRAVGAEALVRWNHPDRGLVGPVDFIPIAEDSGLIVPLGRWVLENACVQGAEWIAAGVPLTHIRVNLSTIQMRDPELLDHVKDALVRSRLPADRLCLEVTESAVMGDVGRSMSVLTEFRDLGIAIAVDDFGTGFSSLAYLQKLPLDILKIDRSFIIDLGIDPSAEAIVTSIIGLAHDLGLSLVGEGIETEVQEQSLIRLGCRNVQGFKYAKPMPADQASVALTQSYKIGSGDDTGRTLASSPTVTRT